MGNFLERWFDDSKSAARRRPQAGDFWEMLNESGDAQGMLVAMTAGEQRASMLLGASDGQLRVTAPQTSALVLGPPRSAKSAGFLTPAIFCHQGPVVSVSTKFDVARNTALGQARKGPVWHYSVDGSPCPQGFKELRWSPVKGAKDWGKALMIADAMVKASKPQGTGSGNETVHHFDTRAGSLIAAIAHYADRLDLDTEYVVDVIVNFDIKGELAPILEDLQSLPGSERAARALRGVLYLDGRERSSVFSTAAVVMKVFELPGVLATTKNPNFDPAEFVVGEPDGSNWLVLPGREDPDFRQHGVYASVYITSPARTQEICAPLVVAFLSAVMDAGYEQTRRDTMVGKSNRPCVLAAIDELGSVPLHSLPAYLADGASGANVLIFGAMQDLAQAHKWGAAGDAFPTLFGNLLSPFPASAIERRLN